MKKNSTKNSGAANYIGVYKYKKPYTCNALAFDNDFFLAFIRDMKLIRLGSAIGSQWRRRAQILFVEACGTTRIL